MKCRVGAFLIRLPLSPPHHVADMSSPVRFALAGFGAWGKFHAQSIAQNPDALLVAISAPSEASREEAHRLYPEAQIFADSLEMIAQADFDLIDIVTPSHTHREIALAAMAKGKHVLLEKPMAITLDDCKAIVAGARQHGVQLAVGHEPSAIRSTSSSNSPANLTARVPVAGAMTRTASGAGF